MSGCRAVRPTGTSASTATTTPRTPGFGDLRVFNDGTLVPGAVWPMHPHRDIEGITTALGSYGRIGSSWSAENPYLSIMARCSGLPR